MCGLGGNLGQIRSSVVKKTKKLALSMGFFQTLHEECIQKQDVVVIEIPELSGN